MATAGDGRAPYESSGAGGKFRKRPYRRSTPATPYDRPPTALRNNNPGLFTKLVDPASRLIYAGVHKLFGVFRKRLPPLSLQGLPGISEEPQNVSQDVGRNNSIGVSKASTDEDMNSAATGISELEQMLKQKTFTRSEIQHLTTLLHSRTTESPDNVVEINGAKPQTSPSPFLRLEASTSGSMKKHGDNRDNFHAAISTPFVSSKVLEEETPSPAEVAKSYMGSRPTKLAPSPLGLTSLTSLQKTSITPKTANNFKGLENGFLTPRSRGRSAMYSMARTPYTNSPFNFNQKEIISTSSQSLKRRSSVLEDDFGSGGPLRRTRQKPNLLLQSREKRELGYTTFQQPMLLENKPEENGDTAIHGSTHGSVPAKSTQTATKIFQQLERLTPKSPTKLTSNMLHGQALRSLEKVDLPKFLPTSHDTQKSEFQHESTSKSTSRGKEKVEENGERKFPVPFNMLTPVNGDLEVSIKESSQIVTVDDSTSILPPEPPQKRRAFQMSAPEDTWELDDDDDDINVNGHVSIPPVVENSKPETSLVANKPVSADIIEPPTPLEVFKTPAPVAATPVVAEVTLVAKTSEKVELKESEKATPFPKTDGFLSGNVIEQETGFKFPTSPPSTFTTQKDKATPTENVSPFQFSGSELSESKPKAPDSTSVFNLDTKNDQVKVTNKDENGNDQKLENIPAASSTSAMFSFASSAAKDSSGPTPTMTPDSSSPIFSSSTPFPASGADANSVFNNSSSNITPASTSIATSSVFSTTSLPPPAFSFGSSKPTSLAETGKADAITEKEPKVHPTSTATATTTTNGGALFGFSSPAAASTTTAATSGGALFGFSSPAATSTTTTTTSGSALFGFGSSAATSTTSTTSTSNAGALFGFSSPAVTSTTTTTSGGALFGFSAPAATSTTTTTSGSTLFGFSSPAATSTTATTTNGGAFFGFSSPAATSTTTAPSQGSFFTAASGSQSNTPTSTPVTQAVPFQFSSSSSLFGSSAPAFGISSSEGKSGNSTSGSTSTTSIFGSSWQPPNSSVFSFGASSAATTPPITFGASSNTTASTGSSMFSFTTSGPTKPSFTTPSTVFGNPTPVFANNNNNDQMSMEDSMAEDSMQTPSPSPVSVSPFGQAAPVAASPGFMFGSATPAPPQVAAPFQFGGQPNQVPPQNPFQSSSVEFNAGGGSFSLGSGGGDKSGRRMVRVTKSKNRRK
ncbi:unnamed protein product [Lactuca saligna]|uniref:Nuclear pore complex protein NUP1 n=1 Tax=Lactuca saligna TaxID=75948 RepID=A0AA36EH74_LACSI|nr:unnamed protein product [Lactuca saligna]